MPPYSSTNQPKPEAKGKVLSSTELTMQRDIHWLIQEIDKIIYESNLNGTKVSRLLGKYTNYWAKYKTGIYRLKFLWVIDDILELCGYRLAVVKLDPDELNTPSEKEANRCQRQLKKSLRDLDKSIQTKSSLRSMQKKTKRLGYGKNVTTN